MNFCDLLIRVALLTALIFPVKQAQSLDYIPFAGFEGYQELTVAPNIYFVAFHGGRNSQFTDVQEAMKTRAAELCASIGADSFIMLKYLFEPVLKTDPPLSVLLSESEYAYYKVRGGGYIYIPIFTPGSSGSAFIDAPSRQAHVRCIKNADQSLDSSRVVKIQEILNEARNRGWIPVVNK